MDAQRRAWDAEYAKPHPLWKGPPSEGIQADPGRRVLELGCGNGKTLAALQKGGGEVIGLDFSRKGLEACSRSLAAAPELVQGDARWLPFADGVFDHVMAFHLLGHLFLGERERAVGEVRRVLRASGGLIVRVFSTADMRFGQGQEIEAGTFLKGTGIPCHYFTREELVELLAGFKVLTLDEIASVKRFHGQEYKRSELVGAFQSL